MCNKHIQGPLHGGSLLDRPRLTHTKLGYPIRTGGDYIKIIPPLKTEPHYIGVCAIKYPLQLQQNSHDPSQGARTLLHNKPHNRVPWVNRCLTSYVPKIASERVSYMTELFPVQKKFPILSPEDVVTHASVDITESLQNPYPSSPIPHLGEK